MEKRKQNKNVAAWKWKHLPRPSVGFEDWMPVNMYDVWVAYIYLFDYIRQLDRHNVSVDWKHVYIFSPLTEPNC